MRTVLLEEIAMAAPEDGVTEGVHADFDEIDTTHLRKDIVTTSSAAEMAKSLPLHPVDLADLHPTNHCAILSIVGKILETPFSIEGLGLGPSNLRKPTMPSP
jgi:hypothetical protein